MNREGASMAVRLRNMPLLLLTAARSCPGTFPKALCRVLFSMEEDEGFLGDPLYVCFQCDYSGEELRREEEKARMQQSQKFMEKPWAGQTKPN